MRVQRADRGNTARACYAGSSSGRPSMPRPALDERPAMHVRTERVSFNCRANALEGPTLPHKDMPSVGGRRAGRHGGGADFKAAAPSIVLTIWHLALHLLPSATFPSHLVTAITG